MKTRYKEIKRKVNELFIKLGINKYPIKIFDIFSRFPNCRVVSYSDHKDKYNLTKVEVLRHFGTDEGCTHYSPKSQRYLVFYNDFSLNYKTPERRRWTLAHELGHICLRHHILTNKTKISRNSLSNVEYNWMEVEANRFASLLLANPIILDKIDIKSNLDIMKICKLSEEASIHRYSDYLKWRKHKYINKYDRIVLFQFHDFLYKKYCTNCNHSFISSNAKCCPICGEDTLKWGDGNVKYKDGVELDEFGRALTCPQCGNEDIGVLEKFCELCGASLYQRCCGCSSLDDKTSDTEGCDIKLSGRARFCTKCGSITTFYKFGYLKDWQEEKQEIEEEIEQSRKEADAFAKYYEDIDVPF